MAGPNSKENDVFNIDQIRDLAELMEQHGLTEINLQREKNRIQLRRGGEPVVMSAAPVAIPQSVPEPASNVQSGRRTEDDENTLFVKSPMVGTFFGRANPEAEPFVKVGDRISADQTVCIIEAMKVFNEIPAEVSGTVVAILVDDEEPVDFGKPLFKIDTGK